MLELNGLTKRFGSLLALDDVTFAVPAGTVVGFVGRNGSGKTTTMRSALGLVQLDSGSVSWRGERPDQGVLARDFGYMPEERGLYPKMRIVDQLRFIGRVSGLVASDAVAAADEWLERLDLAARARATLDALSLGNQQRIQLAAAVLHRPSMLILDEPFSGLDPLGVDVLAAALKDEVARGAAVLFSSHQLDLVDRLCDSVVVIDGGRVVARGTTDELRAARSSRRIEVEVQGALDPNWSAGVAGTTVVERRPDRLVIELDDAADDQVLLDAARTAGSVRRFAPVTPSLADLYREVVPT